MNIFVNMDPVCKEEDIRVDAPLTHMELLNNENILNAVKDGISENSLTDVNVYLPKSLLIHTHATLLSSILQIPGVENACYV